jgi:hypothetical protein
MVVLVVFFVYSHRIRDFLAADGKEQTGSRPGQRADTDPRRHQQTHRDEE